jgi:hypothetical protein
MMQTCHVCGSTTPWNRIFICDFHKDENGKKTLFVCKGCDGPDHSVALAHAAKGEKVPWYFLPDVQAGRGQPP